NGSKTIRARIIDKDGGFTEYTTTLTVIDTAPSGTFAVIGGSSIAEGGSGSVSFTGVNDVSYVDANAGLKYSIDWDNDGTFDLVNVAFPLPSPTGTTNPNPVSATLAIPVSILSDNGSKTIKARVIDKDGGFTEYTT